MRGSQLLQKMLSCSLLICVIFWDSSIGQFVANTSILVKQLGGLFNSSFCDILKKKAVIEEDDFGTYHISHNEENCIAAEIWDTESGSGLMFSLPSQVATNNSQQSHWKQTIGNSRFVPVRCKALQFVAGF